MTAFVDERRLIKASRFLSKHLRHRPERLGLRLQPGGWVPIEDLLTACEQHGFRLSRDELELVVGRNDKQRFSFDVSRTRIRANQGHSVAVDLELEPVEPPEILFHGTAEPRLAQILHEGLTPQGRHHVHLSVDRETATLVGARRGRPVVLLVAASAMQSDGFEFFVSENGVWLVDTVPAKYLRQGAGTE